MIHSYFWGTDPIGSEVTDRVRKELVDKWWLYVCPSDKGCDDPLINPFADGSPDLAGLACHRILVIVAEKDILKDRGRFYYDKLVKSEWKGKAEIMETEGEGHVFYIFNPESDKAKSLFKRLAAFLNQGK
ncbi:probable carboxylesterase 2 [Hibiscus syriacus]|nr:probable carboxylesterase 2 [Hibiscus syriacus]